MSSSGGAQNANAPIETAGSLDSIDILCGNVGEGLPVDTFRLPWFWEDFTCAYPTMSPDGRMVASSLNIGDPVFFDGTIIRDMQTKRVLRLIEGARMPKWSPDGKRLITTNFIYDFIEDHFINYPPPPKGFTWYVPEWSVDGNFVFLSVASGSASGIYRCTKDGTELTPLGPRAKYGSLPFDEHHLIYFDPSRRGDTRVYEIYDMRTDSLVFIDMPLLNNYWGLGDVRLSFNRRKIVGEAREPGADRLNRRGYLIVYDLETGYLTKVLPAQAFLKFYNASWTPNNTLVLVFTCRYDSSATIWEVDTNGTFLRQVIGRDILGSILYIQPIVPDDHPMLISSVYPQPGKGVSFVEFSIRVAGVYSISLIALSGKEVRGIQRDMWLELGSHRASVRTDDLPAGMYLIRLSNSRNQPVYHKLLLE